LITATTLRRRRPLQFTGYRHEIDALAARLAIAPEQLPPISEQDFFARCRSEL
jgi:hypothetical protein